MATARSQGLVAEAQALVDAAGVFGDPVLIQKAQTVQEDVRNYVTSPIQFIHSNPQSELDDLNSDIQKATGVSALDLDTRADLTPAASGNLTGWEKDLTAGTGGNWGAATYDVAGDAAGAAGKAISSALKWALLAFVVLGAWWLWLEKGHR